MIEICAAWQVLLVSVKNTENACLSSLQYSLEYEIKLEIAMHFFNHIIAQVALPQVIKKFIIPDKTNFRKEQKSFNKILYLVFAALKHSSTMPFIFLH